MSNGRALRAAAPVHHGGWALLWLLDGRRARQVDRPQRQHTHNRLWIAHLEESELFVMTREVVFLNQLCELGDLRRHFIKQGISSVASILALISNEHAVQGRAASKDALGQGLVAGFSQNTIG